MSRILLTGEVQHGNLSILNLYSYLLRTKDIWDKSLFDEPVCDQHCLINSAKKMFGSKKFKKFSFEGPLHGLSSALVKLPNILRRTGRSLQGFSDNNIFHIWSTDCQIGVCLSKKSELKVMPMKVIPMNIQKRFGQFVYCYLRKKYFE